MSLLAQMAVDVAFRQFGAPATFIPSVSPEVSVTVVARRADDTLSFGGGSIITGTLRLEIRASEVPVVALGDHVQYAGSEWVVQDARRLDPAQLVWTLGAEPLS